MLCALLVGCNQPQKQESTSKTDDIVWKASLSYCLTNEKLEWQSLKQGQELENWEIYNFKISEDKGHFRDIMKIFYDSAISKTCTVYQVDPANGLYPVCPLSAKDKQANISDSAWNNDHTPLIAFNKVKALALNHEWLFDAKDGALKSTVTDLSFQIYLQNYDALLTLFAFKFADRTTDTMGMDQPGLKPEIVWGHEILMPLFDTGTGPKIKTEDFWIKLDSISRYTVNGVTTSSRLLYPVSVKVTFGKKLSEWILIAARNGQLPAYKYLDGDKIGDLISPKELKNMQVVDDTFTDENGVKKAYPHRIGAEDITGVELKEELAFHQSTFSFESKITYAGILIEVKDKDTHKPIRNTSTLLYWVKLN